MERGTSVNVMVKRLHRLNKAGPVRALCSVVLGDALAIHSIKIVEGKHGLFIQFPQARGKDGQWHDVCHPVQAGLRQAITEAILADYRQLPAAQGPASA